MNAALEILLVEDNPADAELAIHALEKHHLANHVTHIEDGQQALDYFFGEGRNVPPDSVLVLLDLKLPKVGGIEVLRRLRADERTRQVPVVVLTSSREDQDVMRTYDLGANSYIVKPVEFENFSAAVSKMGLYWTLTGAPQSRSP